MVKITVFMPVYNSDKYLKKSIDSILNQSFKDFELLIVDDGSTDRSIEIINSYKDKRIRLIQNEENKGIPYTRNVGLDNARGQYIAIMDSDDIAYKDRLKMQVEYLDNNPEVGVITSSYYVMRKNSNVKKIIKKNSDEYIKAYLLFDSYLCNPSSMIRSSLTKQVRYNEKCFVGQDFDLWVQLIDKTNFASIEKPLLRYRTGHMNITRSTNATKLERRNKVLREIRKKSLEKRNFYLNEEELNILNSFLDFRNCNINKIVDAIPVFKKIIGKNNENKTMNQDVLISVISKIIEKQFDMCKASYLNKRKLKNRLTNEINSDINISNISIFKGNVEQVIKTII